MRKIILATVNNLKEKDSGYKSITRLKGELIRPNKSWLARSRRKDMKTHISKGDASQLDDENQKSRGWGKSKL